MYPELFRIGTFPVTTYGIFLAVGMLLALFVAARLGQKDGLPKDRIYDLGLWTLVGGLVGSKVLMYFVEPDVQLPSLDFLRSGGVFYGGLIGGAVGLVTGALPTFVLTVLLQYPFPTTRWPLVWLALCGLYVVWFAGLGAFIGYARRPRG